MKKHFIVIASLLAIGQICNAQYAFDKGDKLLNVGIGVDSYYGGGIPVGASFEYGITDAISVGGNLDYFSNNYGSFRYSVLYLGARGSYHFNKLLNINTDKFDVYAGAGLGFRNFSWHNTYDGPGLSNTYTSGLYLGIFAGCKYYFNHKIGAFAELGALGSTNARIGLAFKL